MMRVPMTSSNRKKPLVLLILDGWGQRDEPEHNAIFHANTPYWDSLRANAPQTTVSASGLDVGLPAGQMGNSEVGHMSLGAGRIIYQNISRIDKDISDGGFYQNPALTGAMDKAVANDSAVHLFGLMSPGGVHSHERHIIAAIELAATRGCKKVYLHAFLDGRDTPPRSALASLQAADQAFAKHQCGRTATIVGRYYAMDRDNRWNRVQRAYDMLTLNEAPYSAANASDALANAYARNEDDEFVEPTVIQADGQDSAIIKDGDAVLFLNFRSDRARELTRAFIEPSFDGFERKAVPALADFVSITEYAANIKSTIAYPTVHLSNVLGEYLESQNLSQLRISETEKYAHVTFFFSGGREELFNGEQRILINSPDVATYDLQPEMSAPEVTDNLVDAITNKRYDVIICNYANGDMVGHTGNFAAAMKAAEAIDESVRRVSEAVLAADGECLITADHGNCEQMIDGNQEKHTQHTTEHVPFIYVGNRSVSMQDTSGRLCDVAPTMLMLLGLAQPTEMTGQSLLRLN
jgi:2,3-bisphosphoglycerate-independent phosphoglycerate mutase